MDHFNRFRRHLAIVTMLSVIFPGAFSLGLFIWLREYLDFEIIPALGAAAGIFVCAVGLAYTVLIKSASQPLQMVWQAIWHVNPERSNAPPPKPDDIKVKAARELVSSIVLQIYDLASSKSLPVAATNQTTALPVTQSLTQFDSGSLLENIPLALFILDKDWNVKAVNQKAIQYAGMEANNVAGRSIHDVLHLSFKDNGDTLDGWLTSVKDAKATDSRSWEQVRLELPDGTHKQFDLAASYSQANSAGNEVVLALFDRNKTYSTADQATTYVAMAVHELRTPITMLRGYVEMFEDEIGPSLQPEHQEFMRKMSASAQSLSAFVGNILNLARIDENALVLKLQEADWKETLESTLKDLELRAQVRGKRLSLDIAEGLPHVAIDRISIAEVLTNLVENAIKYSGQNPDIIVHARLGQDGLVETTVEDHGVGIPDSAIGGLFTKYYRSHRSKNAVSGTGLGLYLVKSIITAHGGNVWVSSKEGEGSRFTFSLQPFDAAKAQGGEDGLERHASGWIKNHSLYRR